MLNNKVNAKLRLDENLLKPVVMLLNLIASYCNHGYANGVHPHGELALAGYKDDIGVQPTLISGFFVRSISMRSHISMAKLERGTFECAGYLCRLSANPFQLCHHYLAVIGKASIKSIGAHTHA